MLTQMMSLLLLNFGHACTWALVFGLNIDGKCRVKMDMQISPPHHYSLDSVLCTLTDVKSKMCTVIPLAY